MKINRTHSWIPIGNCSALIVMISGISGLLAAVPTAAQTIADSSAYGESVNLSVAPILGSVLQVASGPLPQVSGTASPAYNRSGNAASAVVSTGLIGAILQTGVLTVHASSQMPAAVLTRADATTNGTGLTLGHLIPLLSLNAQVIQSAASIDGTCGSNLVATGSTDIVGATIGGIVGAGIGVLTHPGPNTLLLNLLGVRIILNEQVSSGDGVNSRGLTVNAVHVSLQNSLLSALGVLNGDIVISQSQAHVQCPSVGPANSADLAISGSVSPNPVAPGGTVTYSVTVANHGPNPATGVVVADSLPAGVTFISATPGQGICNAGNPISCNLGTVANGQSVPVTILATVNASQGTLVDTATVSSSVADPGSANNSVTMSTQVQAVDPGPRADLSTGVTSDETSMNVGQTAHCIFTVANHGSSQATSVVLTDASISRAAVGPITSSQGSCSGGNDIVCNLGSLGSGQTATVNVPLTALSAGTLVCQGTVVSSVTDPDPSNNTGSVTVQVVARAQSSIDPGACRIDAIPAATLLIPYFEVDLDRFNGATTLISINNASPKTQLAQVTFWTDWGVPTISYTISLAGNAVQTMNLRDVMGQGVLPGAATGAGCSSQTLVGGVLPLTFTGHMQAWHSGRQSPLQGNCASSARADNVATGYITVDVVNRCSTLNPSNPGYFAAGGQGVASDSNVLWGDFFLVNGEENLAHGDPDVHILAEPGVFNNHYSFYSTFVGGSGVDDRQPLGTSYASRYVSGGAFDGGTQLVVWRDSKVAHPTALQCGQEPARMSLGGVAYDEAGNGLALPVSTDTAPWSTQKLNVGGSNFALAQAFGWIHLDLWHSEAGLFGNVAQGWVTTIMSAQQRYSVGLRAIRLDSACDF